MTVLPGDIQFEGMAFPPAIDGDLIYEGRESDIFPTTFTATPRPVQDHVDTIDGGAQTFQPSAGPGHSDYFDRWTFALSYNSTNGLMREQMERVRVSGIYHTITNWKPSLVRYTAPGGRSQFYLPHYRRNAPQVLGHLTYRGMLCDTDRFPAEATLDGADLTVLYHDANTPVPAGAAGTITIGRYPDETRHVMVVLGEAPAQGQVLELKYFPLYTVTMVEVAMEFTSGFERLTHRFQEK